jgi:ceramide glucosyltransferase
VLLTVILCLLALLSLVLTLWQWAVGRRFPLHERAANTTHAPGVTLLKPLKGCDQETAACLESWLTQNYTGPVQLLFGVADAADPVCGIVNGLLAKYPAVNAQLVICREALGVNSKVSTLIQLQRLAQQDVTVVSDADVRVPADFLANAVAPLREPGVGLVNCFYALANPSTPAMRWEAVAINSDFWSQVLQSKSLKPLDFALGAVMVTRRSCLEEIGGFAVLADYLADDYRLGNLIARRGHQITLCPVVVECWERPMTWRDVWLHQLRWARTIRVCQPAPYFFSLLSNGTLWPLLLLAFRPTANVGILVAACLLARIAAALNQQRRLTKSCGHVAWAWLVPVKDLFQVVLWAQSFLGSHIVWRGIRYRVQPGGKLVKEV